MNIAHLAFRSQWKDLLKNPFEVFATLTEAIFLIGPFSLSDQCITRVLFLLPPDSGIALVHHGYSIEILHFLSFIVPDLSAGAHTTCGLSGDPCGSTGDRKRP